MSAKGRPRTAWTDSVEDWTGMTLEQAARSAAGRRLWRATVSDAVNSTIGSRTARGRGRQGGVSAKVGVNNAQDRDVTTGRWNCHAHPDVCHQAVRSLFL